VGLSKRSERLRQLYGIVKVLQSAIGPTLKAAVWRSLLKSLRVLVIDDEPPARRKLLMMLATEPDIEVVDQAANGIDAVAAIEKLKPDAIFLDIQMPGMNGFEVLEAIEIEPMPLVVFVTAFDQHAVKAFEVHAADYLLKPFDRTRLQNCLSRLRDARESMDSKLKKLLEEFRPRDYLTRVIVKSRGRVLFLNVDDVDWIETSANYVELHSGRNSYLLRENVAVAGDAVESTTVRATSPHHNRQHRPDSRAAAMVARRLHRHFER
jgi:two-component system LytT family response regulator